MITKKEGHYTIKRVNQLPAKGNANLLYMTTEVPVTALYLWKANGAYEEISIGVVTQGQKGQTGKSSSAYDIWLELGNTGSKQDFIDSLKGDKGDSYTPNPYEKDESIRGGGRPSPAGGPSSYRF